MIVRVVTDHGPHDVDPAAGEGKQGLFVPFALVPLDYLSPAARHHIDSAMTSSASSYSSNPPTAMGGRVVAGVPAVKSYAAHRLDHVHHTHRPGASDLTKDQTSPTGER